MTLINTIFLPQKTFSDFHIQLKDAKEKLEIFRDRPLVLDLVEVRFLIEDIKIEAAVYVEDQWQYLLAAHPMMLNVLENLMEQVYLKPFCFFIHSLSFQNGVIKANEIDTEQKIIIRPSANASDIGIYNEWMQCKDLIRDEYISYKRNLEGEIGKC
ncbi:MAG: hypothetical protein EOP48_18240, partial [Sphingobacteriales bacterium]